MTFYAGPVSLAEFTTIVEKALGHDCSSITAAEIDLLFRAFDSNKYATLPPDALQRTERMHPVRLIAHPIPDRACTSA